MGSANPLVVELSKPELLTDSDRQLKLLGCVKNQLNNNLIELSDVVSPLVKLVASNNAAVKVIHVLRRLSRKKFKGKARYFLLWNKI